MTIRLDPSADAHLDAILTRVLDRCLSDIADDARAFAPEKTGELKASIFHQTDGLTGIVGTDCPYWRPVEYGSAAHDIRPRHKKALFWEGAAHPVGRVRHPGTAPHPYLRPALLQHRELR
ncbi:hypothetical protein GCM10010193_70530 [Kitasatospora atroaurantiaca]|uniref:HK97 gp10 family phage protein n=1 Tax=Kitasatospora atroaurantiaca TaxID=285545 RepID=A0A561END6_9ACTN|nr:HK97 gp10 family phage protein [Kitasatospora atroaurantiaca]TWE17138.1 hypothetical protein FB465_2143 [Kitasatospora atroaurantiaca]